MGIQSGRQTSFEIFLAEDGRHQGMDCPSAIELLCAPNFGYGFRLSILYAERHTLRPTCLQFLNVQSVLSSPQLAYKFGNFQLFTLVLNLGSYLFLIDSTVNRYHTKLSLGHQHQK